MNSSLQVLRRITRLAAEWGVIERAPVIKMLPGARHRERVVTQAEETQYLGAASELLEAVATVLSNTGMRPDECYRQQWQEITWSNGHKGTLLVPHGKTAAARRVLPLTPRVRRILETRWEAAGRPGDGWVCQHRREAGTSKIQFKKAASQGAEVVRRSSIRFVQFAPHIFDAFR